MASVTQFCLLDVDVTWGPTTPDPGHNFYFEPSGPAVWGDRFADAAIHQRLEIIGKPSDFPIESWLCIWNPRWDREVCTYAEDGRQGDWPVFRFTGDGVYHTRWPAINTWPGAHGKHAMRFDPHQPVTHVLVQMFGVFRADDGQFRDDQGAYHIRKLREDHWTDNEDLSRHIPFRMRTTAFVVQNGQTFEPPAGW